MQKKNTLFVGCGDLAQRVWAQLPNPLNSRATGITRSASACPSNIDCWRGNADDALILQRLATHRFDRVLITLTPSQHSQEGYYDAYVKVMQALVSAWRSLPPGHVVFVSSTSVYGQNQGEWVDEHSACEPTHFSGQQLLAAEQVLAQSGLPFTIVRPAGIYGPGRDFLQKQVIAGNGGDETYTNRIHISDAARFIAALFIAAPTDSDFRGPWAEPIFNICDSDPAPSSVVRRWLAEQMGVSTPLQVTVSARGGNKRCSNQRLLATGFKLQYPSFRDGYSTLLG